MKRFYLTSACITCMAILASAQAAVGQIVSLQSLRNNIGGDGAFTEIALEMSIDNTITQVQYEYDSDYVSDSDDQIAICNAYGLCYANPSRGWTVAHDSAYAYIGTGTGVADFAPNFEAYIDTLHEAHATGSYATWGPLGAGVVVNGASVSSSQYTIVADAQNPNAGVAANSATLQAFLWVLITPPSGLNAAVSSADVYMTITAGDTFLEIYNTNSAGTSFKVTGDLSASDSTNPTTPPVNIDDDYTSGGINELYVSSQATNVNDIIALIGSVQFDGGVGADNLLYTSQVNNGAYLVHGSYGVTAP